MITPADLAAAEQACEELEGCCGANSLKQSVESAPLAQVLGTRLEATDPHKIALWQAINWLDLQAPGRAREILLELVKSL